ncbi:Beta-galactosidase, partial [termite gut metagenome]
SDGNFCINRVVYPNREVKPQTQELGKVYQNIKFLNLDKEQKTVDIYNGFFFTNLTKYDFYYTIHEAGKEIVNESFKISAEPGKTETVYLSNIPRGASDTKNITVEFYAKNRFNEPFLPAGSIIAREQMEIHPFNKTDITLQYPAIKKGEQKQVILSGHDLKVVFDKRSGMLVSYIYKGAEYIHNEQGMRPFFWRAPTDNDYGASLPQKLSVWKDASYQDIKAAEFSVREKKTYTEVKCSYYYQQTDTRWYITYQISSGGIIKVNNKFEMKKQKDTPMIPRIGLRMQLSDSLTQLSYYGRGPGENYWDRKTSQFLGEYKLPIERLYEPYVRPQENNHRTDVSWFAITNQALDSSSGRFPVWQL